MKLWATKKASSSFWAIALEVDADVDEAHGDL